MINIDTTKIKLQKIIKNLTSLGYKFKYPDEVMPGPIGFDKIQELEQFIGRIPKLVTEFYTKIGRINFIGSHSDWDNNLYHDAFYMEDFSYFIEEAKKYASDSEEKQFYNDCYGGFALIISPDYYHKSGVSGGEPYHIVIPANDNPVISGMENQPRFSEHLGDVIKYGGFPGLAFYQHNWDVNAICNFQ